MSVPVRLIVNGREVQFFSPEKETLLEALRRELKLFSVRESCGLGICGSCTVLLEGQLASSCLVLVASADGAKIETVEAMSNGGSLHTIQQAFVEHTAFQCSFCTPGFLLSTRKLLEENPDPSAAEVRHFLAGNLCRCGSYLKIEEAVLDAAARMREVKS